MVWFDSTVTRSGNYSICVSVGATLNVMTSNGSSQITFDGNQKSAPIFSAVGNFSIEDGVTITNSLSAGVEVSGSSANFTMNGGTISQNQADTGGGVYVQGSGVNFKMTGGTITDNTANNGGGVYCDGSSLNFNMSGGTISNNTALNSGGGVYIDGVSVKFTMTDGTIEGNQAGGSYGDGVYLDSTMEIGSNAKISDSIFIYTGQHLTFTGDILQTSPGYKIEVPEGSVIGSTIAEKASGTIRVPRQLSLELLLRAMD